MPALLREAGYATAAIGKWHLGDCDERYLPTFRGFDHFLGYMAGAQSYYHHAGDMRNGSSGDGLPPCVGESVGNNYSTLLYANEAARIVHWHAQPSSDVASPGSAVASPAMQPLFLYLAFQSVHNPYDVPPPSLIDVNASFPKIVEYNRRIYAGMVKCLDDAVAQVRGLQM
jgi:arylsulfatase B